MSIGPSTLLAHCRAALLCAALAWAGSAVAAVPQRLAWQVAQQPAQAREQGQAGDLSATGWRTPLGSTWKLWVYAYLSQQPTREPVYRCQAGQRLPDEDFCCDPGGSADRDQALQRSCGPYFEPQRLGLNATDWRRFWREHNGPPWLQDLRAMSPDNTVPVPELLQALAAVPPAARLATREALWPLSTRDEAVLAAWGSGPRFKTWSWDVQGQRAGGAAGWLLDGTPFWLGGGGGSKRVLPEAAPWVAAQWAATGLSAPAPDPAVWSAQPCVDVQFFARYPITAVWRAGGEQAVPGALQGRVRVAFHNGTQLPVQADGHLQLRREKGLWRIEARLPLEDYVARVVDREGQATQTAAAQALAVAARSYVLQNATETQACRQIADDSRTQRVSPTAADRRRAGRRPLHPRSGGAGQGGAVPPQPAGTRRAGLAKCCAARPARLGL